MEVGGTGERLWRAVTSSIGSNSGATASLAGLRLTISQEESVLPGSSGSAGTDANHLADVEEGTAAAPAPATTTDGTGTVSESGAQEAARQRLSPPDAIDIQVIASWADGMLPYLCLLAVVFLFHHWVELLQITWLVGAGVKVNRMLRKAWTKQEDAVHQALTGMAYLVVNLWACLYLTSGFSRLRCLLFQPLPEPPPTVVLTLMTCAVVDSIARLLIAMIQLPMMLLCKNWEAIRRVCCGVRIAGAGPAAARARLKREAALLSLMDLTATLYRTCLPVPLWYLYLLHGSGGPVVASTLTGAYITRKALDLIRSAQKLWSTLRSVVESGQSYGRPATREDIQAASNQCPICQDRITAGIRLTCSHTYCEECIVEWLERDTTCPMCRKQVKAPDNLTGNVPGTALLPRLF